MGEAAVIVGIDYRLFSVEDGVYLLGSRRTYTCFRRTQKERMPQLPSPGIEVRHGEIIAARARRAPDETSNILTAANPSTIWP